VSAALDVQQIKLIDIIQDIERYDAELKEKTTEATKGRCPGMLYFLEIFLIKEFIEDCANNHSGSLPSLSVATKFQVHYLENDSCPDAIFS
jgi:hypothetical protein